MKINGLAVRLGVAVVSLCVVSGCSAFDAAPIPTEALSTEPTLAPRTTTEQILQNLPPANQVITVSVYDFSDYTGQNKPGDVPQYSRAVTQGGLSLLKKSLLDAGSQSWFRVLERGGLSHLLEERKIIRSMREQYLTPSGDQLPPLAPLLYSGLLLEGGIVAYESNLMTGGVGARYLGVGGNTEYRRDMVTVSLRAVSVSTGEVLVAVTTSKTIFSTGIKGGLFKFVSFDEIVEGEAGVTANEPPQLAVRQAIEMAVYAMVMEGFQKQLWSFRDPASGQRAYQDYLVRAYGGGEVPVQARAAAIPPPPVPQPQAYAPRQEAPQSQPFSQPSQQQNVIVQSNSPQAARTQAQAAPSGQVAPQARARVEQQATASAQGGVPQGLYIQVVAVKALDQEGKRIFDELKASGLPVRVQEVNFETVRYLRLLVGPYANEPAALAELPKVGQISSSLGKPFLKRIY